MFVDIESGLQGLTSFLNAEAKEHGIAEATVLIRLNSTRMWHPRQNNSTAIGCMYHSNPTTGEKYFLQLLLTAVKGPQSFKHPRTVNGVRHETFHEGCIALVLTRESR